MVSNRTEVQISETIFGCFWIDLKVDPKATFAFHTDPYYEKAYEWRLMRPQNGKACLQHQLLFLVYVE